MTIPALKRRQTLGQITGRDITGEAVTIWVDREGKTTTLSRIANGSLYRYTVENKANLEAEAARVFELTDMRFDRVH